MGEHQHDEIARLRADLKLMEHKVITCGVAATNPDAGLTLRDDYMQWNSPQADAVRALRAERDSLRAERDAVTRHRDDLLTVIKRDAEILRGYGVMETITGDAIHVLGAHRDSLRADLREALRLVAPDVPTMDWDWCKRRGALVAKHNDLLRDADRRAETERIVDAGSLPQHLADAENPLHWFHQWHDDDGAVLWFFCPVTEPPFHVGTPFDSDWPWERGREPQQELIWCRLPKLTSNRPEGSRG